MKTILPGEKVRRTTENEKFLLSAPKVMSLSSGRSLVARPAALPRKERGGSRKGGCRSDGSFYQQTSLTISFETALALAVAGHICKGDKP